MGAPLGPSRQRRAAKPGQDLCCFSPITSSSLLPSQAVQLRARAGGRNDSHGWKKVTFGTILATEGPGKEARLGFPTWQKEGEEKVAQAKKGALPLEVWWGVSYDFHRQLHGFISCSGFYHWALPPLHIDEGLFCKKEGEHGGDESTKGQAVTKLCCSPQGPTPRTKDWQGVVAVPLKMTASLQR